MTLEFKMKPEIRTVDLDSLSHMTCFEIPADVDFVGQVFMSLQGFIPVLRGDRVLQETVPCMNFSDGKMHFLHARLQVRPVALQVTGKRYL